MFAKTILIILVLFLMGLSLYPANYLVHGKTPSQVYKISTLPFDLWLTYADHKVYVLGMSRYNPTCGNWQINFEGGPELRKIEVHANKEDSLVCLDNLKPQTFFASAPAKDKTYYIIVAEEEIAFSGELSAHKEEQPALR